MILRDENGQPLPGVYDVLDYFEDKLISYLNDDHYIFDYEEDVKPRAEGAWEVYNQMIGTGMHMSQAEEYANEHLLADLYPSEWQVIQDYLVAKFMPWAYYYGLSPDPKYDYLEWVAKDIMDKHPDLFADFEKGWWLGVDPEELKVKGGALAEALQEYVKDYEHLIPREKPYPFPEL